ncbi:hypothetical protein [Anaeromyxobacter sp. PSR-1]|uniref:hypothetical protein n=1 Tax=unclassified Anaeromyxobacter TaxID=2620896 RepID=UPI0005DB7788|nr:hypothetical protein [Anaeromyxobacter sp. PSR-1]GAO05318.1 hypothetical protein PSR1_04227 [Anaeromyxobacter sp. PSR-1]
MTKRMRLADLERERSRARGARRLLPWAVASAIAAGLLVGTAGAGWRGGVAVAGVGLLFAAFAAAASVARCPSCGAPLRRESDRPAPGGRPGPADPVREQHCARCGARFD